MNINVNHHKNIQALITVFLALSILMMYPFLQKTVSASALTPSLFLNNGGVLLLAIHTQPIILHVGDLFRIGAIVSNNSPETINFITGPCDSPISGTFDKNVLVKHGVKCFAGAAAERLVKLKSGGIAQVTGPSVGITYQAITSGKTVATVTFHYQTENGAGASITKPFEFNII